MDTATALLLIDIQNDYFPGGRMELAGAEDAGHKAAALLHCFRRLQLPIIHVVHESTREGATFFLPGTDGQRIHDFVQPQAGEVVVVKNFPNSFHRTLLLERLQENGISRLVIAGMMTHMCVDATVRAATDYGFACTLIHDATATRELAFAGRKVPAEKVQIAFIAALGYFCDEIATADHLLRSFGQ